LKASECRRPRLFVIEYALSRLWMSWGAAAGGDDRAQRRRIVAACLAGVFSLEEALEAVAARGRLIQALAPGHMLAVSPAAGGSAAAAEPGSFACHRQRTSGLCRGRGGGGGPLVGGSPAFPRRPRPAARRRARAALAHDRGNFAGTWPGAEKFKLRAPRIGFISNLTGRAITEQQACDPDYWVRKPGRRYIFLMESENC